MSGDVQPRKRKDKKRKKDEGVHFPAAFAEESRGTAAALGEGDVLMHTHSDHGTGGHWCAKLVFFLLLAVLVGLVGLILMENRGLSDLESANTESRYAAVFDGWVDEALPDDHHHDEHTLELANPEDDEHGEHEEASEEGHEEDAEIEDIEKEPEDDNVSEETDNDLNEASDDEGNDTDGDDMNEIEDEDQSMEASHQDEEDQDDQSDEEDVQGDHDDYLEGEEVDDEKQDPMQDSVEALESSEKPFEEVDSSEDLQQQEQVVDNAQAERELEQRRRAQEQEQELEPETSNLGVKVGVGVALVVVAHCVLVKKWQNARNAETENNLSGSPDRRLTLLPDSPLADLTQQVASEETFEKKYQSGGLAAARTPQHFEEDDEDETGRTVKFASTISDTRVMEEDNDDDYLEEDEPISDDEETEDIEKTEILRKINDWAPKEVPTVHEPDPSEIEDAMSEEEVTDPKEVISEEEDEELQREVEEEEESEDVEKLDLESDAVEEEEEISDVDDDDLMKKLEMKYGKLQKPHDSDDDGGVVKKPTGGLSAEAAWPNEPDDKQWRDELDLAQAELDEGRLEEARTRFGQALRSRPRSARARLGLAGALHRLAEERRSNALLASAIDAYKTVLDLGDELPDKLFLYAAEKAIDRIRFAGRVLEAIPVHRLLIARFSQDPSHRNNLAISYLMVNKPKEALRVLEKVLSVWPEDGVALVHYGFVIKSLDTSRLSEAAEYLSRGLATSHPGTRQGRFYFHLGDALLQLGRSEEAQLVHGRAAQLGFFPSPVQRSLYNVDGLTARPWWSIQQTPYARLFHALQDNWRTILEEAYSLKEKYSPEKEGLQTAGSWSQLDVMVRGAEVGGRCAQAQVTCGVVRREAAAAGCRRGQVKFSALEPGTHIRAHVGPTNCRLRAHLALTNTKGAFLRVHNETRTWQEGKVLIFDDSFEHEVWHNGSGTRLVLIVDVWHPDLTLDQRRTLPAI